MLLNKATEADQLLLGFSNDEKRLAESLTAAIGSAGSPMFDGDLTREPRRIAEFYQTKSFRLYPSALRIVWPATG